MAKGALRFEGPKGFKANRRGVREMMRSQGMQDTLVSAAYGLADRLNSAYEGRYDVGPIGEPVTSLVGAHAFVRTADRTAMLEQATVDSLGKAVGS